MQDDFVVAPGGRRRRSEVRLVEAGGMVPAFPPGQTPRAPYARPGVPDTANWITAGYFTNRSGRTITSLISHWVVPRPPAIAAGQVLFLFCGAQTQDGRMIVQPVLQWGDSGPDDDGINRTGPFWTVASWVVAASPGPAFHTAHLRVQPGDALTGFIELAGQSADGNTYRCAFLGMPDTERVTPPIAELTSLVHALEAYAADSTLAVPYDLQDSGQYPDAAMTAFTGIDISTAVGPGPAGCWMAWDIVEGWGEHTDVVSAASTGGEVDVFYRAQPGMEISP